MLGAEFDRTDRAEVQAKVKDAEEAAKDEVWGGYRFVALSDSKISKRPEGHRSRRGALQRKRNAVREDHRRPEDRGAAQ